MIYRIKTNQALSEAYIGRIKELIGYLSDSHKKIARVIADSCTDICTEYQDNGSLDNLNLEGIGPKTKPILELILANSGRKRNSSNEPGKELRFSAAWIQHKKFINTELACYSYGK